jgi:hypothetical protein
MPALYLVGFLALFMSFLISYMLLTGYKFTLGALLQAIASVADSVNFLGWHPFRALGGLALEIDSYINAALTSAVINTELAWHKMLSATATLLHETVHGLDELATATERAFKHSLKYVIPGLIGVAVGPLLQWVNDFRKQLPFLWKQVAKVARVAEHAPALTLPRVTINVKKYVEPAAKAAVITLTGGAAVDLPRIKTLGRDVSGLEKWVKSHEKDLAGLGFAGLLLAGLSRMGLSWLRCSNTQKAGKGLCGLDEGLLDAILAGTIAIFGTVGLVEFAEAVQDGTKDAADLVRTLYRVS